MSNSKTVEHIDIALLKPYPRNARVHSKKQIRAIAKSIERFGFVNPVLVGDDLEIIAGHGRVEAAKLLGHQSVPILRVSHLSEAEKRAYIIADNRLAEKAGWDRDTLAIELQHLVETDFEVEITGFSTAEIDITLNEAKDKSETSGPEDQVVVADGQPVVSRPGDVWLLGVHRLLCADARDDAAYAELLGSGQAALVFTDPPYNVPIDGHVCGLGRIRHREFAMATGEMSEAEFTAFLASVLDQLGRHSVDGAIHFVCMDWRHLFELISAARSAAFEFKNLCVWNKDNGGMGTFYRSKHELVLVFKTGEGAHQNHFELGQHGRYRTNVWDYPGINTFGKDRLDELAMHPTVKPVALVADAIQDCSRRNDLVLDPFAGSGTTFIAAEKTGRHGRGLEIDPAYVDVAVRRWEAYTGKCAVLAGTDSSFEDIAEERLGVALERGEPEAEMSTVA